MLFPLSYAGVPPERFELPARRLEFGRSTVELRGHGGQIRSRTGLPDFAGRCIADLPSGRKPGRAIDRWPPDQSLSYMRVVRDDGIRTRGFPVLPGPSDRLRYAASNSMVGGPSRVRTADLRVQSATLFQLS